MSPRGVQMSAKKGGELVAKQTGRPWSELGTEIIIFPTKDGLQDLDDNLLEPGTHAREFRDGDL